MCECFSSTYVVICICDFQHTVCKIRLQSDSDSKRQIPRQRETNTETDSRTYGPNDSQRSMAAIMHMLRIETRWDRDVRGGAQLLHRAGEVCARGTPSPRCTQHSAPHSTGTDKCLGVVAVVYIVHFDHPPHTLGSGAADRERGEMRVIATPEQWTC